MDAETERQVLARAGAVDDERVRALDRVRFAVAGDLPHHHLVPRLDLLAAS
jgi:hypothetical protein